MGAKLSILNELSNILMKKEREDEGVAPNYYKALCQ